LVYIEKINILKKNIHIVDIDNSDILTLLYEILLMC